MADIRIKDLTTTASSTASDDFIAVDGTTNGTRKLNAFSPTFGGNATVTGTLTVSGATGSLGSSASAATSLKLTVGVGTNASPKYRTIDFRNYDDSKSQAYIRAANRETDSNASTIEVAARSSGDVLTSIATFSDSQLSIAATTASTSTSSGALVVSGGLGVGGAINAGGNISIASGNSLRLYNSGNTAYISVYNFNERLNVNYPTSLIDSTASTSTSSGALVVSGGVGVAKQLYVGGNVNSAGDLTVEKTEPIVSLKRAADTNLNLINLWTGVNADFGIGLRNTSDSDLHIYNYGTSNDALKIAKADSLATFGGAVRTAAPSGGTAANWKLGTVASVSPTSPNRTIEVDIGGTIYYIHAKTTNN